MKQSIFRIITSCGVAIVACGGCIYYTVQRNSIDYQAHPIASLIGSIIPGIIAGFIFYWLNGRRARCKQKKLSSINPKEVGSLAVDNINEQCTDKINDFLLDASARDIQKYIHSIPISAQKAYVPNARIALGIRLAEDAEITTRRIVHLTWALLVVSVGLLAFAIWQTIIIKNDADTHSRQIQATKNHQAVQVISSLPSVSNVQSVPGVDPADLALFDKAFPPFTSNNQTQARQSSEWTPSNSNSTSAFPRN